MGTTGKEHPPARPGRGRRPAGKVRAEILEAAGRLLLDEGMAGFSVARVASVSGALAFSDTGDVEADLRAQLHAFVRLITETSAGRVVAELIGQSQTDPQLRSAMVERYTTPRRSLAVETMERGQARGQLRDDVDPSVVVDQLWGACYNRLLNPDQPITIEFADALLENVWRGIAT